MKSSFSIIFFTVSSGAGFGAFILLALFNVFALDLNLNEILIDGGIALALIVAGLISSTLHLANPRNAWKAFNRFRTSWLSREGVFAVLFFPPALIFLGGLFYYNGQRLWWTDLAGLLAAVLGLATLFSTGMIYASLKPIRQWHNPLVPAIYLLLGFASGGVILNAVRAWFGDDSQTITALTLFFLLTAAMIKTIYFFWIGNPAGPTINTATGFTRAQVRLLDTGHSHGTFLTDEFGRHLARHYSFWLRAAMFVLVFFMPGGFLIAWYTGADWLFALGAAIVIFPGLMLERWLFFIEAQHVVNLYHGQQRT